MSINETTENHTPKINHANLSSEHLDENSSYTHVYMCAVYHCDPIELTQCLKKQYNKINNIIPSSKLTIEDDNDIESQMLISSFDKELRKINLKPGKDPELHRLIPYNASKEQRAKITSKRKKDLNQSIFAYSVLIALFSLLIQLTFVGTLIREYMFYPKVMTDDPELCIIRILSFSTITLNVYIEYRYGRIKFNHSILQGYLYQNCFRRIISGMIGFMQMVCAITCFYISTLLITQSKTVLANIKCMSAMLAYSRLDNWIGDYFLASNQRMQIYTRGVINQIWFEDKRNSIYCNCFYIIEALVFIIIFIGMALIIINTLQFNSFRIF